MWACSCIGAGHRGAFHCGNSRYSDRRLESRRSVVAVPHTPHAKKEPTGVGNAVTRANHPGVTARRTGNPVGRSDRLAGRQCSRTAQFGLKNVLGLTSGVLGSRRLPGARNGGKSKAKLNSQLSAALESCRHGHPKQAKVQLHLSKLRLVRVTAHHALGQGVHSQERRAAWNSR